MRAHPDILPIRINNEELNNQYRASALAQQAFRAANYDMSPADDIVAVALDRGLLIVEENEV